VPDIICMAKAIGGGLPLGVTLARADLMNWGPGAHASTFGGNPVAIAAALKTIELLEGGIMAHGAEVGKYIMGRLAEIKSRHKCVADVRGLGLMIGIEIARQDNKPWPELRDRIVAESFKRGLIVQGAGQSAVRLSPPLIIDRDQADIALEILEDCIQSSASGPAH